jgi:hypothetical protein
MVIVRNQGHGPQEIDPGEVAVRNTQFFAAPSRDPGSQLVE